MSMTGKEAVAGVRVLVCVAKADGVVHEDERQALAAALEGAPFPIGMTLDRLLAESIDLDTQLASLITQEAKDQVFESACSMAQADGHCSAEEQSMLDHIQASLGIPGERASRVSGIFVEARDASQPSDVQPIADPAHRSRTIRESTLEASVLSALLGASPVPGLAIATDLAVAALQVKLVRAIGQYHGHAVDVQAARSLLRALGLGTGSGMAVSNLAKSVPGWKSTGGAAAAFASTFAVSKVAERLFSSPSTLDALRSGAAPSGLKAELAAAEKEGVLAYHEHSGPIAAREERTNVALKALNGELSAGTIDQAEYVRRAAALP